MSKSETKFGKIVKVDGDSIKIKVNQDIAGVSPIYRGSIQNIGQIGSFILVPQGVVDLIAIVTSVGISMRTDDVPLGEVGDNRWLDAVLIGQIDHGTNEFRRGVGIYPGINDAVHFSTASELSAIFPGPSSEQLRIGSLSPGDEVPLCVDVSPFIVRHSAIIGSTGSGKTSAVASILQNLVADGWDNGNIIVIDPHGEYVAAFRETASVRSVIESDEMQLKVPYWALPSDQILKVFTGASPSGRFSEHFKEAVIDARRNFLEEADWVDIDPAAVTSTTPVPFDIRNIWHKLDYENKKTVEDGSDCVIDEGDPEQLEPPMFEDYGSGGAPPNKGGLYNKYGDGPERLRSGLLDPQLDFFRRPMVASKDEDPLIDIMNGWLGGEKPLSVLDFSGIPKRVADIAVGIILDLIFEVTTRGDPVGSSIGPSNPVLVVLEEAHRFMSGDTEGITRNATNTIAKEGRKYGVGLMVVSQRPTDLPDTTLSQCGTIVSLRLSNSMDQNVVSDSFSDSVPGYSGALSSLRTHEAVVSGDSVELPVRCHIDKPSPWPDAEDPNVESWRDDTGLPDLNEPLSKWRDTYQ